ncbi:hypothetical protein, partial [Shewanella xiamenensis]|uniref:hypothetical protein n=1 Tax=Shewanella xiamenensis TaxID=332186 RepID=UPI001A9F86F9
MSKPIFVWMKSIKFSANLPTANCEFIASNNLVSAITSADIARNCQVAYGLAQIIASHDYHGNTVVCTIKTIPTKCTEQQYSQMIGLVNGLKEGLVGRFLRPVIPHLIFDLKNLTAIGHSDLLLSFAGNSSWPLPLSLSVTSTT